MSHNALIAPLLHVDGRQPKSENTHNLQGLFTVLDATLAATDEPWPNDSDMQS